VGSAAGGNVRRDGLVEARVLREPSDQPAVELDDARGEVGDVLEVRVAGAEVVDDEVDAASAHLVEHVLAEPEVRQRHRLGDLEVDVLRVLEDGIIRLHDPAFVELGGMDVEKQRVRRAALERHAAQHAPELARAALRDGGREHLHRALEVL